MSKEERYAQAFKRFQDAARRTCPPYDRKHSTAGWGHVCAEAERRAAEWTALAEAARVMHDLEQPPPAQVTRDGTLRLPQRIQQALGVENGGGVSFVDKGNGVVEVMSDDVFLEKYTGEDPR